MTQPATTLSVVKPPLPAFEGANIASVAFKITGALPPGQGITGTEEQVLLIDDRVRLVGDYRVVGVYFKVDPKTGDTIREHILKPLDLGLTPYDPQNPQDDGIWRARPNSVPVP